MLVVSLTSIPPRYPALPRVLASLRAQDRPADRIWLTLPRRYRRFPGAHDVPPLPQGVELLWSDEDFGPATKALPAARALRGTGAELVFCDDDCLYGPGWLAALRQRRRPGEVAAGATFPAARLKRAGPDVLMGFAGVALDPAWLDRPEVRAIPDPLRRVDDVWLSGHLGLQGRPLRARPDARAEVEPLALPAPLQDDPQHDRAEDNRACLAWFHERHGLWPPRAVADVAQPANPTSCA